VTNCLFFNRRTNRNRNLQTSKASLKSQTQGISLFANAMLSLRDPVHSLDKEGGLC